MNKPQAEARVNHVCTVERRRRRFILLQLKNNQAYLLVYLKSFLLISMAELDHQRSAANTLVNKMGIDICVVEHLIITGLHHILSLHFTVLIHFDELMHIYI